MNLGFGREEFWRVENVAVVAFYFLDSSIINIHFPLFYIQTIAQLTEFMQDLWKQLLNRELLLLKELYFQLCSGKCVNER